MRSVLTLLALASLSLSACAKPAASSEAAAPQAQQAPVTAALKSAEPAAGSADARAVEAIKKINPQLVVDRVGPAPMPGFREVIVAGTTAYVSDDGKYLLQGSVFDMTKKADLSEASMNTFRKALLATAPQAERIVFAPANPKYTVSVFTDYECGYCRKLHSDIAAYNKAGIAVEYLAFPRMGMASEDATVMANIWCSADRKKALTDAKNGKLPPNSRCTSPVAKHYAMGQRAGLKGTPMIIAANGAAAPGYLSPSDLLQWLDAVSK
jgi:thiol:disulfide interchange protein DsbC